MAVPKRKKHAKKMPGRAVKKARLHQLEAQIQDACTALTEVLETFGATLDDVNEAGNKTVLQPTLKAAVLLDIVAATVDTSRKSFKAFAISHRKLGGTFEPATSSGDVEIAFPQTTRRTPKWKAVAIDEAEAHASAIGQDFAEEDFIIGIQEGVEPSTSTGVKLTMQP